MRNILGREESEEKKKRNVRIAGIILLLIMVVSTAGYAVIMGSENQGESSSGQSNDKAVQYGNRWYLTFGGADLSFASSPEQVSEIEVSTSLKINDYYQKVVYVDSENEGIKNEVYSTLGLFTDRMQEACYGPCNRDLPEKDCSNLMIIWKNSENNRVYQNESCVFIEGDMKAADAFLYNTFGKL